RSGSGAALRARRLLGRAVVREDPGTAGVRLVAEAGGGRGGGRRRVHICRNVTFCDAVWRDARHRTEDVLSVSPWPASHDYGHDRGLEISMTAALDQTTLTDRFVTAFRNHPAGVALVTA